MLRHALRSVLLIAFAAAVAVAQPSSSAGAQKRLWLASKLEAAIADEDRKLDGILGVAVLDLKDGQTVLYHADEIFPTASSIKIAVLAELYHQDEQASRDVAGKAKLTDIYVMNAADLVPSSDIMAGLTPGVSRVTNRDLATFMVAVSDNSATNVLIDRLGMSNINTLLEQLGLKETRLRRHMMDLAAATAGRENTSTPREMVLLLENIYRHRIFEQKQTDDFLKVLSTHKDSFIPRLLPADLAVANKPGALEAVRTDSGIVMLKNRPFIISIMTTYDRDEHEAEQVIARISAAAFRYFERLDRASPYGRVISPH